ncbi:lutropin-choriogonadotropic hormone receptor-like [Actinia tenebrosa]|uniref:Lutropin-choriogonadotropic hormone receptor-like n=1 Tax=Actinia tenebrosa TaxID=6105 RepID=A0A6P8HCY2_ACTTE|nr:lutropin-choriogonadotropic hormone receptor-like [Actinia tenebrosa]
MSKERMKLRELTVIHYIVLNFVCAYDESPFQCSPRCICFLDDDKVLTAKCKIQNGDHRAIILPDTVQKLDLSSSNLTEVPSLAFSQLQNISGLSLANNHISKINEHSFKHLPTLQKMNLSNNSLREWDIVQIDDLANLTVVDISGNAFMPDQRFLRLPMLKMIIGVAWRKECEDCLIVKTEAVEESFGQSYGFCAIKETSFSFHEEIDYGMSIFFAKNGFSPQCLCQDESCADTEINKPYNMKLNLIIRHLFYVEYIFGFIAIGLNFVVVLTIAFSRTLYKPPFLLLCNIALCDLFMGVYTVLIGRYTVYEFITNEESYKGMDTMVNLYCSVMGFIFTTSQVVVTLTSLLTTLERYFSIVYCMDPSKKLRKKMTSVLIIMIWCCGITYAALPLFRVGGLRYHGEFTCMLPFLDGPLISNVSDSTFVVAVLLSLLYIISIFLYLPIYRSVKNSNVNAGVRRNATLAKNIAVMITTNFIFSLLPLISTILFVYCYDQCMAIFEVNSLKQLQIFFICLSWLPIVLLSINSCLNPLLCAFRNPKIKFRLFLFFKRIKNSVSKEENSNSDSCWRSGAVGGIELADTNNSIQTIGIKNLVY